MGGIFRSAQNQLNFGDKKRMASSSTSLPRRQHASSVSSSSSSTAPAVPRRITLTIPPLKAKTTTSVSSAVDSPGHDGLSSATGASKGQRPKIKLKARKSIIEPDAMLVDSPTQDLPPLSLPLAPPPPPAIVKAPRPIKLKPLREVLSRLITQIKRKDDYAFFLHPVDPSQVTGYSDVVQNPMDFGTMTEKVEKGNYRSLEQFKDDFVLVTTNAKAFNPPGTIYHSEADRLEAWGLDHISKASAQVIEYETDWTIDVVADGDPATYASELPTAVQAESAASIVKTEDDAGQQRRSPSVMSSVPGTTAFAERTKRSSRAKKAPTVTESWEEGGHLPGFKDGLAAFPARSDMAVTMLDLKLRGKRFRTKKERLRREREGPPVGADGSLDFTEMEHPFTVLQQLVPNPPSLPRLLPLVNTQSYPVESAESTPAPGASQPPEAKSDSQSKIIRGPVALPSRALPSILADAGNYVTPNPASAISAVGKRKLQHWTIIRNPPRGFRPRDADDGDDGPPEDRLEKRRRVAESTDYGSFAILMGELAAECGITADEMEEAFGTDEKLLDQVRISLQKEDKVSSGPSVSSMNVDEPKKADPDKIVDAEDYVTDVVYGGIDGLAYIRSLAEFVGENRSHKLKFEEESPAPGKLGMPLSDWVETHIVDQITHGNHSVLRNAARALSEPNVPPPGELNGYLDWAQRDKSDLMGSLKTLLELADPNAKIDIAALLRAPQELFVAENEWAGADYKAQQEIIRKQQETKLAKENAVEFLSYTIENNRQDEASAAQAPGSEAPSSATSVPTIEAPGSSLHVQGTTSDTAAVIEHALTSGADAIIEIYRRAKGQDEGKGYVPDEAGEEDPLLRRARLNLIAIAKRAPIDKIARLPPDLVPSHIRHIVPTLS